MNQLFELPASYKKWTIGLIAVGIVALLYGFVALHPFVQAAPGEINSGTRFWAVLLQNSVYWLLITNASMFFICITTLAMGGWQVALRRVPEAISSVVPVLGIINLVVLMTIVWGKHYDIYEWVNADAVAKDDVLNWKKGFLSPGFFTFWSFLSVAAWSLLGKKLRSISLKSDKTGPMDYETGNSWIKTNIKYAAAYTVFFGLTVGSVTPWLWLMSIDAHWYSTMYSWYTFASSFVAGLSLLAIFVIYLKNKGQLEYVTDEHLHDVGKFMFAFSIFWTYLWFAQYMLIWYANIPDETKYFKIRVEGPFRFIFFANLIINFIFPLLILMKRGVKRNWTLVTIMAVVIIFGHWLDFWQMVMPGTLTNSKTLEDTSQLGLFEFGIAAFFIGIIMWRVGVYVTKNPLLMKNHPFLKESMIHHT
jgi:hypothetical protein